LVAIILIAAMVSCSGGGNGGSESYDLTVESTAGGVVAVDNVTIPGKTMFAYGPGTVVSLNATPNAGYQFTEWTGNVSTVADVHAATTIITMNGNYSIVANFEELLSYNLTISSTGDGSVTTPGQGTFTCYAGTVVTLVASPASCSVGCCGFLNWTGDTEAIANVAAATTTIIVNDDCVITANFKPFPPEGEPIDCQGAIAHGRQTYSISTPNNPKMGQIVLDPLDVNKCAWQEVTVWAKDLVGNPIYQMIGEGRTNSMTFAFTLSLVNGTEVNGVWQGYWYNEDEYCSNYMVAINATSESGTSIVELTFK
jgi:hypothetical protein